MGVHLDRWYNESQWSGYNPHDSGTMKRKRFLVFIFNTRSFLRVFICDRWPQRTSSLFCLSVLRSQLGWGSPGLSRAPVSVSFPFLCRFGSFSTTSDCLSFDFPSTSPSQQADVSQGSNEPKTPRWEAPAFILKLQRKQNERSQPAIKIFYSAI